MPRIYEGERPYIFVNYAHADRGAALQIIGALEREGYRVWYDDGIQVATVFPEYIADHIHDCACFVMLVSRASLASDWCRREVYYALELHKTILPIYMEDVELTRGLRMSIGPMQSLFWHRLELDAFYERLFGTSALYPCLDEEGKARRGVGPRAKATSASKPSEDVLPRVMTTLSVRSKGSITEYSWTELKLLSQKISAAASNEEGLKIARQYHLVDKDGKLQGDEKPLQLKDGTKTSVRILGFRHDELVCGGKAGISFEFAGVPAAHRMNVELTNAGGWEKGEMRKWLNSSFLRLLPHDLSASIEATRKRTNNWGKVARENDVSVVTETADRLWLLSMSEVYGRLSSQGKNVPWSPATYDAEGTQYQFYADKGVSTKNYASCAKDGARSWWWLRSPGAGGSYGFLYVSADGVWYWGSANGDWGVSPGFCF